MFLKVQKLKKNLKYLQAEARAEFAERSVQKLQKEVDRLEGNLSFHRSKLKSNKTINIINESIKK